LADRAEPFVSPVRAGVVARTAELEELAPHAFGERPVLTLMYAAIIRAADQWHGITVGEFEQRQPRAIPDELNRAHASASRRSRPHASRCRSEVEDMSRVGTDAIGQRRQDRRSRRGSLSRYSPQRR
jgi:hypothetical protein